MQVYKPIKAVADWAKEEARARIHQARTSSMAAHESACRQRIRYQQGSALSRWSAVPIVKPNSVKTFPEKRPIHKMLLVQQSMQAVHVYNRHCDMSAVAADQVG